MIGRNGSVLKDIVEPPHRYGLIGRVQFTKSGNYSRRVGNIWRHTIPTCLAGMGTPSDTFGKNGMIFRCRKHRPTMVHIRTNLKHNLTPPVRFPIAHRENSQKELDGL